MRTTCKWLGMVGALVTLAACSGSAGGSAPSCDAQCARNIAAAMRVHVAYLLTGHAPDGANITYSLGDGGTEQQNDLGVPMTNKASGNPGIAFDTAGGAFLYFSAQNQGGGHLTCKIMEDGQMLTEHTSSGEYAIVTCSATA